MDSFYNFVEDNLGTAAADWLSRLILAAAILFLTWVARRIVVDLVSRIIPRLTKRTQSAWDDQIIVALQPPVRLFVGVVGLWMAIVALDISNRLEDGLAGLWRALVAISIFWALFRLVEPVVDLVWTLSRRTMNETQITALLDQKLSRVSIQIIRAIVVILGFAAVLEGWGYNVAGVVAGLGLTGLAVALAAQETLENLLGYFVILADEPFVAGEYIVLNNISGTVEHVGFRSSRIRALDQSVIIVPNKTLVNASITNWSRLEKRRINMTLGITYDSSPTQILSTIQAIRQLLKDHEQVQEDSVVVQFTDFNDSSLDLMIICFTHTPGWNDFQAVKQDINLKIMDILEDRHVEVAFPSRTVYQYVQKAPSAEDLEVLLPMPEPEPAIGTATDSPVPDAAASE